MSKIGDTERTVQNHVISLFSTPDLLDYEYIGNRMGRANTNTNIEADILKKFLLPRIKSERLVNFAIEELRKATTDLQSGLYAANKAVYSLLKYGIKIRENPGEPERTVYLIDWLYPERNIFSIAEEVAIVEKAEKRPDIVVYINGIAIAVIELKKSTISAANGIRQNITNQNEHFIQPFFSTIQFTLAGNPGEGLRYGTVGTGEKSLLSGRIAG